jgi:hypothetical protein
MIRAIIPAHDFLFLTRFASGDTMRRHLNGVSVETAADGGAIIVATDGKAMGIMRLSREQGDGYANGEAFILVADKALIRACKAPKRMTATIVCRTDRIDVIHSYGGIDLSNVADAPVAMSFPASLYIDGQFPNWHSVVPTPGKHHGQRQGEYDTGAAFYSAIDTDQLARFDRDGNGVSFDWNGPDPMLVTNSDHRFVGVLMPVSNALAADQIAARRNEIMAAAKPKLAAVA